MFKFFKKMKKNRKGYTLTELIVVVAILGVLAAIGVPMIMNAVGDSRDSADAASIDAIETAVQLCLADGSLVINASNQIAFGTAVAGSSATTLQGAIEEKLVGHDYPTASPDTNRWFLNLITGAVTEAADGATIVNSTELN